MTSASVGDTVRVHYVGRLDDGAEFDSSAERDPLELTIGDGSVIRGFEEALVGMAPGERKTVTVGPEEAYGPHRAERVAEIERSMIPPDIDLVVGGTLYATGTEAGTLRLTVIGVGEESVTLDANHPLAGKDLTFELHLVEIVAAVA